MQTDVPLSLPEGLFGDRRSLTGERHDPRSATGSASVRLAASLLGRSGPVSSGEALPRVVYGHLVARHLASRREARPHPKRARLSEHERAPSIPPALNALRNRLRDPDLGFRVAGV